MPFTLGNRITEKEVGISDRVVRVKEREKNESARVQNSIIKHENYSRSKTGVERIKGKRGSAK